LSDYGFNLWHAIVSSDMTLSETDPSKTAGDIPMSRVKMNAKQEYEYLTNYKVLQTAFKNKKIDKVLLIAVLL
jgi:hypothetical protein